MIIWWFGKIFGHCPEGIKLDCYLAVESVQVFIVSALESVFNQRA